MSNVLQGVDCSHCGSDGRYDTKSIDTTDTSTLKVSIDTMNIKVWYRYHHVISYSNVVLHFLIKINSYEQDVINVAIKFQQV